MGRTCEGERGEKVFRIREMKIEQTYLCLASLLMVAAIYILHFL